MQGPHAPHPYPKAAGCGRKTWDPRSFCVLAGQEAEPGSQCQGALQSWTTPPPTTHTLALRAAPHPLLEPVRKNGSVMPGRMDRKRVRRNQEVAQTLCPVQLSEPLTPHLRLGPGGLGRRRQRGCGRGSEGRAPPAQSMLGTRAQLYCGLGRPSLGWRRGWDCSVPRPNTRGPRTEPGHMALGHRSPTEREEPRGGGLLQ